MQIKKVENKFFSVKPICYICILNQSKKTKIMSDRKIAFTILEELRAAGFSDTQILEDILGNQLSGSQAADAINATAEAFIDYLEDRD
jgi:hypothetical protein